MGLSSKRLLKLLKAQKDPQSALALFDSEVRHPSYKPSSDVYHHILRRLVHPKLVGHVGRIVCLIKTRKCKCPEDVAVTVMQAYAKNLMPDKALDIFQNMGELFGCKPGIRISDAIRFLDDALDRGILPTAITWYILVRAVIA
ncbi:hypothetical protein Pint_35228 [Pistacia integerrima]|uniref:Uncharacterized protein n=1 Tax=Pistacia integerrima TaxID=434235 RepID=A0ACC0Y2Q8_9ROSI|nr:hypothetical protein Pint_35228 [Pistacia integerrima]